MKTTLVLGATGWTGRLVCKHRPDNATMYAGLRRASYVEGQRSLPDGADASRAVGIDDHTSLPTALEGVDVVVNAIHLREDITTSALVELHQSIVAARGTNRELFIVHVGGAGALYMGDGRRFWETPGFPAVALSWGIGHAHLRDYLEQYEQSCQWAYFISPSRYTPDGPYQGRYSRLPADDREQAFLTDGVSYEDFAAALVDTVHEEWHGVWLIGGQRDVEVAVGAASSRQQYRLVTVGRNQCNSAIHRVALMCLWWPRNALPLIDGAQSQCVPDGTGF